MDLDANSALTLVRDLRDRSETRQQHARAAVRGSEVRVARGAYVSRDEWDRLDPRERHLLKMSAAARIRPEPCVFSHWSAATALGLPLIAPPPESVHLVVPRGTGGRSGSNVTAHASEVPPEDCVDVAGLRCTSPERTAVDLAGIAPTGDAVAVADHVLRLRRAGRHATGISAGREELHAAWRRAQPMRGHRRALDVIDLADERSGSPLESVSRVAMHTAGVPQPELQTPFRDAAGLIGYVDFYWSDFGVVGEADGDLKYLDPALRGGRTADRVVLDEKIREDRLRALGLRVVRWRWATARDPRSLAALLSSAGVPLDRRAGWRVRQVL